jgi:phospholipid/cholesterol/gamma-HCH transport system substrate-binding protein
MAIAAMVILAVLIFLLTGEKNIFARSATLYTYLSDSAALTSGAAVRLNGIYIGKIDGVELSGSSDPNRTVRLVMSVQRNKLAAIPVDSQASITAENVLGTKYINIKKGKSQATVRPGGELPSLDVEEFEDLVRKGYNTLDSVNATLRRIDNIVAQVEAGKGTVGKLLVDEALYSRMLAAVTEVQKITAAVSSGKGTLGRLVYDEALYDRVMASLQRLDTVIQDVQQGQGTMGKLLRDPALYEEARAAIAEFRRVGADLNAGKGTAGKLLKDEAAYRQIRDLLTKLDAMVERVNSGQGTLGQLLVNPQLYESLSGATSELRTLIKDVRANPKKFLRIKLGLF